MMEDVMDDVYTRMPDPNDEAVFGCLFPGSCCMAGEHFFSECHTSDMLEQLSSELETGS